MSPNIYPFSPYVTPHSPHISEFNSFFKVESSKAREQALREAALAARAEAEKTQRTAAKLEAMLSDAKEGGSALKEASEALSFDVEKRAEGLVPASPLSSAGDGKGNGEQNLKLLGYGTVGVAGLAVVGAAAAAALQPPPVRSPRESGGPTERASGSAPPAELKSAATLALEGVADLLGSKGDSGLLSSLKSQTGRSKSGGRDGPLTMPPAFRRSGTPPSGPPAPNVKGGSTGGGGGSNPFSAMPKMPELSMPDLSMPELPNPLKGVKLPFSQPKPKGVPSEWAREDDSRWTRDYPPVWGGGALRGGVRGIRSQK